MSAQESSIPVASCETEKWTEVDGFFSDSTIWLARGMPAGGRLITLESDPAHAAVARTNIARAGLQTVVELRLGSASDTLPQISAERRGPFDLIFIDADKKIFRPTSSGHPSCRGLEVSSSSITSYAMDA